MENLTLKDVLSRIGYFRDKKGLSAYEVSLQIGKCKNYISRVESGKLQVSLKVFFEILEVLEVSLFEFFYPNLNNFNEEQSYLKIIKSMSNDDFNALKTLLKIK